MSPQKHSGFTLVELLVVIAIIGTLVAMLLPAVQAAREAARRSQCSSNLKQIGLAVQMHHDTRRNFPKGRNSTNQKGVSWAFELLPYIEQQAIHQAYVPTEPVFATENAEAMRTPVDTYFCPSRRSPEADRDFDNNDAPPVVEEAAAGGDYAANAGLHHLYGTFPGLNPFLGIDLALVVGPIFSFSKIMARQVTDGLSQTLAIGERHIPDPEKAAASPAGTQHHAQGDTAFFAADTPTTIFGDTQEGIAENRSDESNQKFGSEHSQLVHFVFLDGHVTPINTAIETTTLQHLSTIGDGEVIPPADL